MATTKSTNTTPTLTYAQRRAERDAKKAAAANTHEAELRRLERERAAANGARDSAIAEADRIHEETSAALDKARAKALVQEFDALVGRFADAPRTTAGGIADCWKKHHAALLEETGEELSPIHLAMAFARVAGAETVAKTGAQDFWNAATEQRPAAVADRAARLLLSDALAPEIEAELRALELSVVSHARREPHGDAARAAALSACASHRRIWIAAGAYTRARDERTQAEHKAAFEQERAAQPQKSDDFEDIVRAARREAKKVEEARKREEDSRVFGG